MAPSLTTLQENGLPKPLPPSIKLEASTFSVNDHPILTEVPPNIVAATASPPQNSTTTKNTAAGCFVGFNADEPLSRLVVSLGKLRGIRFMSIFRFKLWWSTHWTGSNGSQVEHETQIMILENSESGGRPYVLLLPLIEGAFRASLQPGLDDFIDVCMESGSTRVAESTFKACLYMHANNDPYTLVHEAMKVIRLHLGTFKLLEEKTPPAIIDRFGWCTWDAFYLEVHPQGVRQGIKSLADGGCPPGLVIIDDGWQTFCRDDEAVTDGGSLNCRIPGEQMLNRLIRFQENCKFREYECCKGKGMGAFVRELKEEFAALENVYVWHAFCGYWGGIRPKVEGMPETEVVAARLSKGAEMLMTDLAVEKILENGVGVVAPHETDKLYEGLHSHLQSVGVDGVKIDVTHVLEMLSDDYGGRVELAKPYYKALTDSVKKHFKGNGVISSMQQCNDFMFLGTETISLGRVGDDFWCTDPAGDPNGTYWLQGCHMVHCAYNSLWMGNIIHPDWDMFQSDHACAEFHAASRAISGGPVYYTGVLGLFNCQGGGWCPASRRNKSFLDCSHSVTCIASPKDIEWSKGKNLICTKGVDSFAVYMVNDHKLRLVKYDESIEVSLEPFAFELMTVSPVMFLPRSSIQFAPFGLVNMLNSGGSIQSLEFHEHDKLVRIGVRGHGQMAVFAAEKPVDCKIDGQPVEFDYNYDDKMVKLQVPWPSSSRLSIVEYFF